MPPCSTPLGACHRHRGPGGERGPIVREFCDAALPFEALGGLRPPSRRTVPETVCLMGRRCRPRRSAVAARLYAHRRQQRDRTTVSASPSKAVATTSVSGDRQPRDGDRQSRQARVVGAWKTRCAARTMSRAPATWAPFRTSCSGLTGTFPTMPRATHVREIVGAARSTTSLACASPHIFDAADSDGTFRASMSQGRGYPASPTPTPPTSPNALAAMESASWVQDLFLNEETANYAQLSSCPASTFPSR